MPPRRLGSEPPHARGLPLSPDWMRHAGFVKTSAADHRGQLYRPPEPCVQCHVREQQCLVIALRPAPVDTFFYCSSCHSCNGNRKCSLASRMDDWAWRWDERPGLFVPERLPQAVLDRRRRNREGSGLVRLRRVPAVAHSDDSDGGEDDDSSDEGIALDSDTGDSLDSSTSLEPTAAPEPRGLQSAPPMSARAQSPLVTNANPAPRQGNEAPRENSRAPIVVKHEPAASHAVPVELWDSDKDDTGNTFTTSTRPKRVRNASMGPSKRTRTSTLAPNPSATLAIAPVLTVTPNVPARSSTPAATAPEVERLKAELERMKVERDSALEERDALLELYRNSVQRTRLE